MNLQFVDAYRGKTVLITGHTGFKGSWLSEWLLLLGAKVVGYALEPPTTPSHFGALELGGRLVADLREDVRSLDSLESAIGQHRPDFVFHLAAQSLVRRAFAEPRETFETNVLGSVNVLEAVRRAQRPCVVIMVTTDKVYDNREWLYAYRESDPLGGHDPYSASKAAAEIAIASYQRSFFDPSLASGAGTAVASVRGGNVVGGGDWAQDRIVPDCIRALVERKKIPVRNRHSTRPWQHVLELLGGYLHLGSELARASDSRNAARVRELCSAFNFGPEPASNRTVEALVGEVLQHWPGGWEDLTTRDAPHEAGRLSLAIDKAFHVLGWQPRWTFEESIRRTMDWYREYYRTDRPAPDSVRRLTQGQIHAFADEPDQKVGV